MVDTLQPLDPSPWKATQQTPWLDPGPPAVTFSAGPLKNSMAPTSCTEPKRSKFLRAAQPPPLRSRAVLSNAHFKTTPITAQYQQRPMVGRCCPCLPQSRSDLFRDEYKQPNLQNLFKVDTMHSTQSWLSQTFCYFVYIMRRTVPGNFPDLTKEVLGSVRVTEAIQKLMKTGTDETKMNEAKLRKRASAIMNRMKSRISSRLLRFVAWFLHKFLSGLFTSILINKNQIMMLKQASKKNLPLIFLPTHRSHLDYILVTFVLVNYDIRAPHVAAGDNLLIPFFGTLLRGLGGFFIRRRLDPKEGQKDHMYRAVLQTYMEEILKRGDNMEFFIEGGRTRSGKASYPKGGLLSVVLDTHAQGSMKDALLVPTTISYDKLIDGHFNREQLGERKVSESFWGAVSGIWKVLSSRYGYVRVDFGQPFSLQEYTQTASLKLAPASRQPSFDTSSSAGSDLSEKGDWKENRSLSVQSLYGCALVREDQTQLVQNLAEHIVYTQSVMQPLMSSHLLSFICLTMCRKGALFSEICQHYNWLKMQLDSRNKDIGVTGKTETLVHHAQQYVGDNLLQKVRTGSKSDCMIVPNVNVPEVFELAHYAAPVMCAFAAESVIAHSIYALVDTDVWHNPDEEIIVYKEKTLDMASRLGQLLKYEFIFNPPCSTLSNAFSDAFDSLVVSDILAQKEEQDDYTSLKQREWSHRLAASLAITEEDSDEDFEVPATQLLLSRRVQSIQHLQFLRAVTAPILETYYITACNLNHLLDEDLTEDQFTKKVHDHLKQRVRDGTACYAECSGLDCLKNALKGLQHMKVINRYVVANVAMIRMGERYKDEGSIQRFLRNIGLHLGVAIPK